MDLINIRVVASAAPDSKVGLAGSLKEVETRSSVQGRRQAYFGGRMLDTPVVSRAALRKKLRGPCIVEEVDATCIVPPGATASLDAHGNILIDAGE